MKKNIALLLVFFTYTLLGNTEKPTTPEEPLIYFNLKDDPLNEVLNRIAAYKQSNIILPGNPADQKMLAETKVNFKVSHKIKLSHAWEILITMLDVAGFAVIQDQHNLYTVTPNMNSNKEAIPLYVNIDTQMLPKSDATIRYLYYFQNINLKEKTAEDNLSTILKDMLPGAQPTQFFDLNKNYNALLITGKANIIRGIMNILSELDQNGFRESIEVVPIFHTSAQEIVNIINQLIPKSEEEPFRVPYVSDMSQESKTYFSSSTRIVSIDQTNSVAIFGLYDSVQRVKDFIRKYLDKKVDAEKTVLHVKPLQYLNAEKFADTLKSLIERKNNEAQSSGENKEKILSNVIIVAEKEEKLQGKEKQLKDTEDIGPETTTDDNEKKGPVIGGNNLIVACTQKDWKIINKLIDELDIEQWQVAIEVLIVDMTIESANQLGTQIRRLTNDGCPHALKWQSAQLNSPILDYTASDIKTDQAVDSTTGIESDLLSQQPPTTEGGDTYNIATNQPAGSTIFSFKDGNGMNIVMSLLRDYSDTKIVSQPFVVARNNEQATILDKEVRMVRGTVENQSKGGTAVIKYEPMTAATLVRIRPRISKEADSINLEIDVQASQFNGTEDLRKRKVTTNANVGHKEVLVLGGISEVEIKDRLAGSPILSKIPIIGYLFKNQLAEHDHRNLMVFISPSRIIPVSQSGKSVNSFTKNKVNYIANKFRKDAVNFGCPPDAQKENFQCLQDPITNFLFHPEEGSWYAQALEFYADRGIWAPGTDDGNDDNTKTATKKVQQKKQVTPKKTKAGSKNLKTLLKNQENPFSKK